MQAQEHGVTHGATRALGGGDSSDKGPAVGRAWQGRDRRVVRGWGEVCSGGREEGGRGEVRDPRSGVQGEGWAIFRGGARQPQVRRRSFPRC